MFLCTVIVFSCSVGLSVVVFLYNYCNATVLLNVSLAE